MGLGGSTQQGLTIRRHAQLDQQTCILVLCWCSRILFPRKSAIEQRFPTSRRRLHRSGRCASHRCSPLTPVVRRTNSTPAASLSLAWPPCTCLVPAAPLFFSFTLSQAMTGHGWYSRVAAMHMSPNTRNLLLLDMANDWPARNTTHLPSVWHQCRSNRERVRSRGLVASSAKPGLRASALSPRC
jgi:hypothetical protein